MDWARFNIGITLIFIWIWAQCFDLASNNASIVLCSMWILGLAQYRDSTRPNIGDEPGPIWRLGRVQYMNWDRFNKGIGPSFTLYRPKCWNGTGFDVTIGPCPMLTLNWHSFGNLAGPPLSQKRINSENVA